MTKERFVSDEEFGKVSKKIWELERRVKEGTLDVNEILQKLQRIIERNPEINLEKIREMALRDYRIHPNGGGRLIGDAHADPGAYIDKDAIVGGKVWIRSPDVRIECGAIVDGDMAIDGKVKISKAHVFGNLWLMDSVQIDGNVSVIGIRDGAMLTGKLYIGGASEKVFSLEGFYKDGIIKP